MAIKLPGNTPKHQSVHGLGKMSFETADLVKDILRDPLDASDDCYCFHMLWNLKSIWVL